MAAKRKSAKPSNFLAEQPAPLSRLLRVPPGPVAMAEFDPAATPGYPGKGKRDAPARVDVLAPQLSDLQERLYADGISKPETAPSVLVVLQGMDTSGKGGVIRHSIGLLDPQGVQLKAFKTPTPAERRHHYLWRIERALPSRGMVGIFDRSHYEDVLIARVDNLVPESVWSQRYDELNEFEAKLVASGTTILKCMLNVSFGEQRKRLAARLADPTKHWKYHPSDLDSRAKWPAYVAAYDAVLERCNTDVAPWHVIPADRKWYRNWAVAELLRETLAGLNTSWPAARFDVQAEIERLAATD